MLFRDGVGNTLEEGDAVAVALGQGQLATAKVMKLSAGLGGPNTQQSVPMAHIAIVLDFQAAPNGVVPGIMKIEQPRAEAVLAP